MKYLKSGSSARLYAAVALIVAIYSAQGATAEAPVVEVESGKLQGETSQGIVSFKGVPFALPPVGMLRWRAPQPAARWTGVRKANEYGHDCMQLPFGEDAAPLGTAPSEDCLVLNVWRPANAKKGLPVIVWIYGGGLVNGGSSPSVYDGSQFARQGLVFVSYNYRLGRFGFFAHPALSAEGTHEALGNYGYLDQIAAMQWINKNIAAFGGDSHQITLFGESAGGASVHMLMTSSQGQGLFQRAIVESGGGRPGLFPLHPLRGGTPDNPSAEEIGTRFAKSVGIEGTDAAALQKLRALTGEQVIANFNLATMMNGMPATYSGPMLDGELIKEDPALVYAAGHQAKVPMIVGANNADIGFTAGRSVDEILAVFGADRQKAIAAYRVQPGMDAHTLATQVGMDRTMVEPARYVAASVAKQGEAAYEYRFSYVAESMRSQWTTGTPHATEIPYVFDTVKAKYGKALAAQDEAAAQLANRYWVNFAKTGNPNGKGLPEWPRYEPATDQLLEFTASASAVAMPDPWKGRLDVVAAIAERQH